MRRQIKYALSFLRSCWSLSDYPIRIRFTKPEPPSFAGPGWKPIAWVAQIEGWLLAGHGDTRKEALSDLARKFEEHKARNFKLPRPGTKVPVTVASTERVSRLEGLANDFLRRIFELDPENCLLTDESSLFDFTFGHSLEPVFAKIQLEFGVDASAIERANVADILERIAAKRAG
jgi:hypothetical protein